MVHSTLNLVSEKGSDEKAPSQKTADVTTQLRNHQPTFYNEV